MDKLAFDLLQRIEEREAERATAFARGDTAAAGEIALRATQVEVVFEGDLATLLDAGFSLRLIVPGLAGGRLTTEQTRALAQRPNVLALRLPAPLVSLLDKSLPQIRAPDARNHIFQVRGQRVPPPDEGGGVTIGIIDSGIHAGLQTLKRNSGSDTIIVRLWDQTFRFNPAGEPVTHTDKPLKGTPDEPTDETGARATVGRTPKAIGLHADLDYGIDFTEQQINQALSGAAKLPISLTESTGPSGLSHGSAVAQVAVGHLDFLTPDTGIAPAATFIFVKRDMETGAQGLSDAVNYIIAASRKVDADQPIVINCSFGSPNEPRNGTGPTAVVLNVAMADPRVAVVVGAGNDRSSNDHAAFEIAKGSSYFLYVYVWDRIPKVQFFFSYSTPASLRWRMAKLGGGYDTGKLPVDQPDTFLMGGALGGHVFGYGKYIAGASSMSGDRHFVVQLQRGGKGVEPGYWVIEIESDPASAPAVFMHVWRILPSGRQASAEFIPLDPMTARLTPTYPPFAPRQTSSPMPRGVVNPSPQDALRLAVQLPHPLYPTTSYARDPRPEAWIQCTIIGTASAEKPIAVGAYDAEKTPPLMTDFSGQGPDARFLAAGLHKGNPKPDIAAPGEAIDTALFQTGKPPRLYPLSGTSFAAPHVTGVLALMWAANPNLTNLELKSRLLASARKHLPTDPRLKAQPGGWIAHNPNVQAELWGAGMLDALDAVKEALKP